MAGKCADRRQICRSVLTLPTLGVAHGRALAATDLFLSSQQLPPPGPCSRVVESFGGDLSLGSVMHPSWEQGVASIICFSCAELRTMVSHLGLEAFICLL